MTRYPKDGKGKTWTVIELKSIKPEWKGDTLNDSDGLFGDVRVADAVSIHFRYAFKWNGKLSWHYCGTFPSISVSKIRDNRDDARDLVKAGIDPRVHKVATKIENQAKIDAVIQAEAFKIAEAAKAEADAAQAQVQAAKEALTFDALYQVWIKDGVSRGDDNKYLIQSFRKHALPALGNIELRHLSEQHLRDTYRNIIAQGKIATAVELSKDIGQMLRWAEKRKPWRALLIDGNPSELVDVDNLVPKDYTKERTRQLSVEEIIKLKTLYDASNQSNTPVLKQEAQIATWLCLGTLCRIGELLMTEWRHVDFVKGTWFIPAANTKGERGKKCEQLIYLSDFTLAQFKQLHALTGDSAWAFPARFNEGHVCTKTVSKQIGDRQIQFKQRTRKLQGRSESNALVLGEQEWTPHDLRRTGATMMQKLKISREVINLCQNHVIGSKVDRVYLLDDYADEKRDAWDKLGKRLEEILAAV